MTNTKRWTAITPPIFYAWDKSLLYKRLLWVHLCVHRIYAVDKEKWQFHAKSVVKLSFYDTFNITLTLPFYRSFTIKTDYHAAYLVKFTRHIDYLELPGT